MTRFLVPTCWRPAQKNLPVSTLANDYLQEVSVVSSLTKAGVGLLAPVIVVEGVKAHKFDCSVPSALGARVKLSAYRRVSASLSY